YTLNAAGAVVFYRGEQVEYLLLLSTFWGFPKGHVEAGEDERSAALREIREESGLEVTLVDGFRYVERYVYQRKGALRPKQAIYFLGETPSRDARLSTEHTNMVWLPFDLALARLEFDGLRETLRSANAFVVHLYASPK
ncbi:MAG: NUDIX domain-containing protein, partial [Chloroflexi bacterium]|nr:NUDIX domain-containing protein [Chloroflexota bacterium]